MGLTDSYEPAGEDIVSEEIDGEVIIVNLQNGNYYSLTQSGTDVWASIEKRECIELIQRRLEHRYSGEPQAIEQDLAQLLHALEHEGIIVRRSTGPEDPANGKRFEDSSPGDKKPYEPPMFERFTDMEDLLLLDPVHEVEDEKGWPHTKDKGAASAP